MVSMTYEDCVRPRQRKNKPKQSQSMLAPSTAGGWKTKLKKQSQFLKGQNKHKCLCERKLWKIDSDLVSKKQSQTKPISRDEW